MDNIWQVLPTTMLVIIPLSIAISLGLFINLGIVEAQENASLRNANTNESNSVQDFSNAITALITTAGAIGGGITGGFFTYRNATKIEDRKDERELKRQREYSKDMRSLIIYELSMCKGFVKENYFREERLSIGLNIQESIVFTKLPIEKKLQVLDPGYII